MTDRIKGFTVVLEKEMRTDDVEYILNAIRAIRGVGKVTPHVMTADDYFVREQAKREIWEKVNNVFLEDQYPEIAKEAKKRR